MFKMFQISKEAYTKYEIKIIDDDQYFWISRWDLETESDYKIGIRIKITSVNQKNKNIDKK